MPASQRERLGDAVASSAAWSLSARRRSIRPRCACAREATLLAGLMLMPGCFRARCRVRGTRDSRADEVRRDGPRLESERALACAL